MKKLKMMMVIIAAGAATVGAQQDAKQPGAEARRATEAVESQKKDTDCNPQRAGVRCRRKAPRKPWLFGKG